jgi:NitT/TauT family transport system substrate-binding protein
MKISYIIGFGIAVLAFAVVISLAQSYTDTSGENIRVAFFPSIVHAVPIVGIENKIFQQNLSSETHIEVRIFDSGPQVIESLFSNSIDIAYVGPGPVINGYLKSDGNALKILAGAADGGASLIAQKDSGLESIENFDGKRIAAPQISNTQDVSLRYYLSSHGFTPVEKGGTVYVLNISNPDIYTLFAKGDIDGAWVPEPWATILVQDLGGVRVFNESQFWPEKEFSSVLLIGRTDFIEKNPEVIKNWIKSNEETVQWINTHPDKAKQVYSKFLKDYMGKTLPDEIIDESFSNLVITSDPLKKSVYTFAERADSLGYLGRSGYDINEIFYDDIIPITSMEINQNG